MVHLSRSWMLSEGCNPVRAGALLPVPSLLRARLRESARRQDAPGLEESTEDKGRPRGSPNMMKPFPEKPKGMHWSTYNRFWWEHHEAEMAQLAGLREWLDKFEEKVG